MIDLSNNIGPYMGASFDQQIAFGNRRFRVALYGAFNAMGLIGSEMNGIVIFDQNRMMVVLDEHCREDCGYYGPSQRQIEEFERICNMNEKEFCDFVRNHRNARPVVDINGVFYYVGVS